MKSPYHFIVEPLNNEQYNNTVKIGDKELIVNTSIEEAKDVQRLGVVISLPMMYSGEVQIGDTVVVHHNVFRITLNDNGIPMQSNNYIVQGRFYVEPELIYMVIRNGQKIAIDDNVFIEPLNEDDKWLGKVEKEHVGKVKYANRLLRNQGINEGDIICFRMYCQYEFEIEGERLYNMKNHRILGKYQHN